ncbi:MAG TPA: response regulator [Myxococcales bacterium]|nr:response regulator [Myxococcales bacterium]
MACVLIVDDDRDTRESLQDILVGEGYDVRLAASGGEALAFLRGEERPAIILLDDMMPQMTGEQVLDWMRAHPQFDGVPTVLISGDIRPAPHARATAVLRKPFSIDDLLEIARRYCGPCPRG